MIDLVFVDMGVWMHCKALDELAGWDRSNMKTMKHISTTTSSQTFRVHVRSNALSTDGTYDGACIV